MNSSSEDRPGEFALIAELFAPLARMRTAFGLTDDAATLAVPKGRELVVTTDAVVAGVHFRADDPAETIARKALRVNLSDLAAKGAKPLAYVMALSLPRDIGMAWLRAFARGLAEDQSQFGIGLIGGDTTATPGPLSITITAFGSAPRNRMIRRKGARPGDLVFVSGTIGDAGGGLALLKSEHGGDVRNTVRAHLVHRYQVPQPRTALGPLLQGIASAALDVSDGLIADIGHIADVSGVRIVIDGDAVPRSAAIRTLWGDEDAGMVRALTCGDDYEIAFTVPLRLRARVMRAAQKSDVPISLIGRVERGRGVVLERGGRELRVPVAGWQHL